MGKIGENFGVQLDQSQNKKQMIDEARTSGATVHFASLMDICHLKNAELEAKHQKYKGRLVLGGDGVKDDSGSYAVFTEQGSSTSQMTAEKNHGCRVHTALLRLKSQKRNTCLHPDENGKYNQTFGFVHQDATNQHHFPT